MSEVDLSEFADPRVAGPCKFGIALSLLDKKDQALFAAAISDNLISMSAIRRVAENRGIVIGISTVARHVKFLRHMSGPCGCP